MSIWTNNLFVVIEFLLSALTMNSLKTKISLKNFFIFNSTFCNREGEDENKVLFFYPEIDRNEKLKDVGFIEALIKFSGSFSFEQTTSKDVLTMKTSKTMRLFFEPEKDFWVGLTINVPFERKEKDKKEYIEYYSDDAHEAIYKKVIQRSYRHFRLFWNTFASNMIGTEIEDKIQSLRDKFDNFYTKYLLTINLQSADIVDAIECIQYRPVTHLIFFRIVNFLNMVMAIKSLRIQKCIFLYKQEVVYSSVNPTDLYMIHEYLNESLFPKFLQRRNNQNFDSDLSTGCFVTEFESDTVQSAPKVYLQDVYREEPKPYRLIVFNILDVSLVMLITDVDEFLGDEFANEIKYSIGPQLGMISKEITENFTQFQPSTTPKSQPSDETAQEKYIYFNHKNHRFHACFYDNDNAMSHREGRKTQVSTSVMNLLCDLYSKEEEDIEQVSLISSEKETIIKTFNDYWICSRTYNNRSLYVIIHKSSTLIDVAEESQRLMTDIVKNVYFTNQQ